MTRCVGDTERRARLNPNVHNVFFMRAESIVILEFSLCESGQVEAERTER